MTAGVKFVVFIVLSVYAGVNYATASTFSAHREQRSRASFREDALPSNHAIVLQDDPIEDEAVIEGEGFFDVVEQPENFIGVDYDGPAKDEDAASEESAKSRRKSEPASLLFERDLSKIQSNARNIENDSGNHFFYENNIIVEPQLPAQKVRAKTKPLLKDDSKKTTTSKHRLRQRMSFKRHSLRRTRKQKKKNGFHRSGSRIGSKSQLTTADAHHAKLPHRDRRAVTAKKELMWDHGVIPYEVDTFFSPSHKALFKQAMRHWENFTCLKFVEREPRVHPNYIFFTETDCGCCSNVGKRGTGVQNISIGQNCEKLGIVLHELGHVIGFWHEHTRTDRDQHIVINEANIMKGQEFNFNILPAQDIDSLGAPYDYNSIMHYKKDAFSKNAFLDTILPIGVSDRERIEMGQRVRLSRGDILQTNLLYKCTACGRTFQQHSGQIVSPHYSYAAGGEADGQNEEDSGSGDGGGDNPFDRSLEKCEWRITATNGERIILQVHQLSLLQSDNCQEDYLEVRDGYWYKSPVIKRICGNATAVTIKSDSSRMLISYVNRNAVRGFPGFTADFEVKCGGDIFLIENLRIDSPNYPLEYLPDRECIWRITVPDKHQVGIRFQFFELENHDNCIYDYVEIRDGEQSDSELIGIFCGNKHPANIKSNSNQMYLKFVSDGSVQKVGFSAIFMQEVDECKFGNHGCQHECINTVGSYKCGCFAGFELQADGRSCGDACGGIIDARSVDGTLSSPSFPDVYPISKKCVWELVAPPNHAVFLNFSHFDLEGTKFQYTECNYDYLVVHSKLRDSRLKRIGIFCGNEIPPLLNSEQNILRLEFHSDKSVQHTGFLARYEIDKDECSINNGGCQHHCHNTFGSYDCSCRNGYTLHANRHNCTETNCKFVLTNSYGIISSPNYPNNYPRSTYCFWHFQTVLGHRLQLTFNDFDVENHQECIYDYVAVYDGRSENSSTLGTYCGGQVPYTVQASTNQMFMVLKTDAGLQRKGFMATYSTECGGYLRATNRSQVFYSHPRYGRRPYKRNMYCNWRIQADPESSVKIKFLHFEIEYSEECDYDYVEVTEELSPRNKNHGTYCGNQKPPSIISYSDMLLVRFQTDRSTALRGFVVSFVAVEPPDDDVGDDIDFVTPFPGYIKNVYYDDEYREPKRNYYLPAK